MTRTTATTTATPPSTTFSGLRTLSLVRAAFSVVWVALVLVTSTSLVSPDAPTAIAAVLLVVYPLWDAVATFRERRITGTATRVNGLGIALGLAATVAMIAAVFNTVGAALLVFGIWALVSGAIQLVVALRRRRTIGAQWPMIISGGLSVLAGGAFAAMSASPTSGLATVAGYSAFGAFWFLVSAIALMVRTRRATR
jgi:uncharacterized membrane protein HdeD (DUF308 family)